MPPLTSLLSEPELINWVNTVVIFSSCLFMHSTSHRVLIFLHVISIDTFGVFPGRELFLPSLVQISSCHLLTIPFRTL
jgi:hypothetical protein